MKFKYEGMSIHSINSYTRSAAHVHGRRFDNSPVECAQVIFHKTLEDGSIESQTNHLVKVDEKGTEVKWQVGKTGLLKIYIYINQHPSSNPVYVRSEIIEPPPPPPPKKKKRRRRRRKNRKPQNQAA